MRNKREASDSCNEHTKPDSNGKIGIGSRRGTDPVLALQDLKKPIRILI